MWNSSQYLNLRMSHKTSELNQSQQLKKNKLQIEETQRRKKHGWAVGGCVLNILMQFQLWVVVNILFQNPCRMPTYAYAVPCGFWDRPSTVTLLSAPSWAFFLPHPATESSCARNFLRAVAENNQPNDDSTCWSFHTRHKYIVSYLNITYIYIYTCCTVSTSTLKHINSYTVN